MPIIGLAKIGKLDLLKIISDKVIEVAKRLAGE